jgi:hypothetical protein
MARPGPTGKHVAAAEVVDSYATCSDTSLSPSETAHFQLSTMEKELEQEQVLVLA